MMNVASAARAAEFRWRGLIPIWSDRGSIGAVTTMSALAIVIEIHAHGIKSPITVTSPGEGLGPFPNGSSQ
jgi:hypothetical protein